MRGCGSGLRITASEGERALKGFGGSGGGSGTFGGADAPRGIGGNGWDWGLGNTAGGGMRLGGGMNGGGLGGKVGVVVGEAKTGVIGGSGDPTDCVSRYCGMCGEGAGWNSR